MRNETRPWLILPSRLDRDGARSITDALWVPADVRQLDHLVQHMRQAPHGSSRVRPSAGACATLYHEAKSRVDHDEGLWLSLGTNAEVGLIDLPDGEMPGEAVDASAVLGADLEFRYEDGTDTYASLRLNRQAVSTLLPLVARDPEALAAAFTRLGKVTPGELVKMVRGFGDRSENTWVAAAYLRRQFPSGLPMAVTQALIGHPRRAVREAVHMTFSRTQGTRHEHHPPAPTRKTPSRNR